ncbi:hypothetical protein D3C73_782600 [compost metagenome]
MMDAVNVQTWIIGGEPHRHFARHRCAVCSGNNELRGVFHGFGAHGDRQFDLTIGVGDGMQLVDIIGREIRERHAQGVLFFVIP